MLVKVSELSGDALNYAVALCEGYKVGVITIEEKIQQWKDAGLTGFEIKDIAPKFKPYPVFIDPEDGFKSKYHPSLTYNQRAHGMEFSTNPVQAYAIIEREGISIVNMFGARSAHRNKFYEMPGNTGLEAAMRCYVAITQDSYYIEIPDELMQGNS